MSRNGHAEDDLVVFEANMDAALRSHYLRTGMGKDVVDQQAAMPFERLLMAEDDGISGGDEGAGEYEMHQRMIGVRAFLRWVKLRAGVTAETSYKPGVISNILMQLFAAGRAAHDPFFSSISFTENGLLFSQTKAAASFRSKLISGFLEKAGAKGIRAPGQKSPESSASYRAVAKGNTNRRKRVRQSSFLKKLKTNKESRKIGKGTVAKPKQASFLRKLNKKSVPAMGAKAISGANVQRSTSNAQRPSQSAPVHRSTPSGGILRNVPAGPPGHHHAISISKTSGATI